MLELVSSEFLFREYPEMPEGRADKDTCEHGLRADACILRTERSIWVDICCLEKARRLTGGREQRFYDFGCDGGIDRCDLSGWWFC